MTGQPPATLETMSDPASRLAEFVERKGAGHPDTICDAIAEAVSRALGAHYLARFGRILHHNVDKVLLVGGESRPRFGGGELLRPIGIVLAGRATAQVGSEAIPVESLALAAAKDCIRGIFRRLDPDRDIRWDCRIRPGSIDLARLFARGGEHAPLANDTSAGAGFAPLSPLERFVLEIEAALSGSRRPHAACGEDVKLAGVRRGEGIDLTVACAAVAAELKDLAAYARWRDDVAAWTRACAKPMLPDRRIDVVVNGADDLAAGDCYLTVTGTSAESGDDGETGRGNRVCGLISVGRPLSMEAAAGKNPVSHVGKLYSVLAQELAEELVRDQPAIRAAECVLATRVGTPIDRPMLAHLRLALAPGCALVDVADEARARSDAALARVTTLWRRCVAGELRLF